MIEITCNLVGIKTLSEVQNGSYVMLGSGAPNQPLEYRGIIISLYMLKWVGISIGLLFR